jgi:hypothetical protein
MELSRLPIFTVLVWSLHLFPMGYKIPSHFFFKFAPAGENVREVKFTSGEYDVSRGVAIPAKNLDEDWHSN